MMVAHGEYVLRAAKERVLKTPITPAFRKKYVFRAVPEGRLQAGAEAPRHLGAIFAGTHRLPFLYLS